MSTEGKFFYDISGLLVQEIIAFWLNHPFSCFEPRLVVYNGLPALRFCLTDQKSASKLLFFFEPKTLRCLASIQE
ncbi:hypothetical protein [Thermosporothrix hazakensis]|uniref:hypothetical protein n=1 Tax=Thermosporothrix hazakensis TaxID=644383 RepID=UPI0010F5C974|nr:hypothetical protein [Thermosporothrix hazakensis]